MTYDSEEAFCPDCAHMISQQDAMALYMEEMTIEEEGMEGIETSASTQSHVQDNGEGPSQLFYLPGLRAPMPYTPPVHMRNSLLTSPLGTQSSFADNSSLSYSTSTPPQRLQIPTISRHTNTDVATLISSMDLSAHHARDPVKEYLLRIKNHYRLMYKVDTTEASIAPSREVLVMLRRVLNRWTEKAGGMKDWSQPMY